MRNLLHITNAATLVYLADCTPGYMTMRTLLNDASFIDGPALFACDASIASIVGQRGTTINLCLVTQRVG